jgi:hypothetical protein
MAAASAFTDECGDHLQASGVNPLQGGDVERYGLRFVEQACETLLQGARVGDSALSRQGECVRRRFLLGCGWLPTDRVGSFGAI